MSDAKPHRGNLDWLPALSREELQRELDALCQLRMMLAGLALRHAADPDNGRVDEGLNADIAAIQAHVQQSISRVRECVGALGDLVRLLEDQKAATEPANRETLH